MTAMNISMQDEAPPRFPAPVSRRPIFILVFSAGFASLGVELAASRLLDPWFGNSIFVWASLIGLILLYLAAGYWLGGRLADRDPRPAVFFTLAATAGLLIGLIPLIARPILRLSAGVFASYDIALLAGSFAASLLLFGPAVILLGCASPFAIRLLFTDGRDAGRTAGRVFALSTLGSLAGVFLTTLLLIPNLGTRRTFFVLALSLLGLACLFLWRIARRRALFFGLVWLLLFVLALLPAGFIQTDAAGGSVRSLVTLHETESAYNYIRVVRNGPEVVLKLNEGAGVHSVYNPQAVLADGIWDYFLLAPYFTPARGAMTTSLTDDPTTHHPQVGSLLMLGLAAGTVPKLYTAAYGPVAIDGVELDPAIIAAGQRFFAMSEPNLHPIAQDARYFLRTGAGSYDVIAIDAYRPPYIPFHLTTIEFFRQVKDHLNLYGVVAINVARAGEDYSLVDALAATLLAVFPSVFIIDEPAPSHALGNSLVVASAQTVTLNDFLANTDDLPEPILAEVARRTRSHVRPATPGGPVLTDDHAPIEQIIHGIVLRYLTAPE